jgi:ABC-type glycerol-3-phosphate transport system substrate-binding protein
VAARNSAREEQLASDDFNLTKTHASAEQLPCAKYMPTVPALLELLPRLGTHVVEAIVGQADPQDALNAAESEVNDILSQ